MTPPPIPTPLTDAMWKSLTFALDSRDANIIIKHCTTLERSLIQVREENEKQKEFIRSQKFCSKPGCGYPDGLPCIGCGRIVKPDYIDSLKQQLEEANKELGQVDEIIARRPALDKPTRK